MTKKEVVLYPMARCCGGVSEYTQVLTLNHPHQKGQQHASISADSVSQLLLLHHQWHWCRGFYFILSRLIIKQLYIYLKKINMKLSVFCVKNYYYLLLITNN